MGFGSRDNMFDIGFTSAAEASARVGAVDFADFLHNFSFNRLRIAIVIPIIGRAPEFGCHINAFPSFGRSIGPSRKQARKRQPCKR